MEITVTMLMLCQREPNGNHVNDMPIIFSAGTRIEALTKLRGYVDENFDMENCNPEGYQKFLRAFTVEKMVEFFDNDYCYYQLVEHTCKVTR